MVLKGLHGRVDFEVQRLIECTTGERRDWLELSGQFPRGRHMTPGLCEVAAYYSNRLSYEEVAGLVERLSGERVVSDQRIEELVLLPVNFPEFRPRPWRPSPPGTIAPATAR